MKQRITITIDDNILKKLDKIKNKSGASISFLINRALKKEFKLK